MPAPALRIPVALDMQSLQQQANEASNRVGDTLRVISKKFVDANATIISQSGAAGRAVLGVREAIGALGPASLALAVVVGTFKLMSYAVELAKDRIKEYDQVSRDAASAGLTPEYFQRLTKAAEGMKLETNDLTEALQRFDRAGTDRLGGSDLQKRVAELQEAGNFQGNSGVGAFRGATNSEDRLRAIISLIDQAIQKGERLAALDIAERAFGPKIADNLRSSAGYLTQLEKSADQISKKDIVSNEDVARMVDLKNRMEEAQKVLAGKFKPIQDDLAKLGVNYQESWVSIYQTLASAVGEANKLYAALKEIPDLAARFGNASFFKTLQQWAERGLAAGLPGFDDSGIEYVSTDGAPTAKGDRRQSIVMDQARQKLAALLGDYNNIKSALREIAEIETRVFGDKSKNPDKKIGTETRDRFQASADSIERRTSALEKETENIDRGTAARERSRIVAELETVAKQVNTLAGIKNGEISAEQRDRINEVADAYAAAADKAERARLPLASFARDSADSIRLLNSALASSLDGFTNDLAGVVTGTRTTAEAFRSMANSIIQDLARIAIRKAITGPIGAGLSIGKAHA